MPRWEYRTVRVEAISLDQMKQNARDVRKAFGRNIDWIDHNRLDPDLDWDHVPAIPGDYSSGLMVA